MLRLQAQAAVMPAFDEETGSIVTCAGPPRCTLTGDKAVQAAIAGCPFCSTERVDINGVWHKVSGPSEILQ